jgi:hypothetical protein
MPVASVCTLGIEQIANEDCSTEILKQLIPKCKKTAGMGTFSVPRHDGENSRKRYSAGDGPDRARTSRLQDCSMHHEIRNQGNSFPSTSYENSTRVRTGPLPPLLKI